MSAKKQVWGVVLFLSLGYALAQEKKKDTEEVAVIEIGAAPSRNVKDHTSSLGPTLAVEVSPIEKAGTRDGRNAQFRSRLNRMVDRPFVQEALDAFSYHRIHGRCWPGVDSHERVRHRK